VNLSDKISFICIDKRTQDSKNGQTYIILENGKRVVMPPNIHSVPAMLLIKENYRVIYGDEIATRFKSDILQQNHVATRGDGEPMGYPLQHFSNSGSANVVSEQYTFFDMTPEELSARGKGGMRQLYNYVPAALETMSIQTPPDTYRPDKIANSITIDTIQQQRNSEMGQQMGQLEQQQRLY